MVGRILYGEGHHVRQVRSQPCRGHQVKLGGEAILLALRNGLGATGSPPIWYRLRSSVPRIPNGPKIDDQRLVARYFLWCMGIGGLGIGFEVGALVVMGLR